MRPSIPHRVAASARVLLLLLGILPLLVFFPADAQDQAPEGGLPAASEAEKGAFVRHLLATRHLRVGSCRFAQAECERLMNDFARGNDVEFIEPVLRSEDGQDAAFRELISPCLPPPVLGFDDTNEFYRGVVERIGRGYATGPFFIYRLPLLAGSAYQNTVLIRMTGFRFSSGILEYFLWTEYARLDLAACDAERENSSWLFQLGDDTRSHSKTYFADGVVRLGDEYYLFELRQDVAAPLDTYDAAAGIFTGSLWKLQGNIKAISVLGFGAQ